MKQGKHGGTVCSADWGGQNDFGDRDISGRDAVVVSLVYGTESVLVRVDGCDDISLAESHGYAADVFQVTSFRFSRLCPCNKFSSLLTERVSSDDFQDISILLIPPSPLSPFPFT
jgi:hypothetical protein